MAGATAFAFGSGLSHAYWAPIATIIAMKPVLGQTTIVAAQRLIGAAIGALAAILLMLIAASEHGLKLISIRHGLELIGLVLLVHAVAIRFWNYALYTAAIAAGVLVFTDLPNPSNYSAEGDRILWTLVGLAIGVLVMLLGALIGKLAARRAKNPPQAVPHPA